MNKVLAVLILFGLTFSVTGEVYKVYLDREFGFWGVRPYNLSNPINYTDKTLNIRTGDTIVWENADSRDDRITVISDSMLWNRSGIPLGGGYSFSFTFNSSGKYMFHILENSRIIFNYNNETDNTTNETDNYDEDEYGYYSIIKKDIISYEHYPFQYQYIVVSGPTIGNGTRPITYYTIQKTTSRANTSKINRTNILYGSSYIMNIVSPNKSANTSIKKTAKPTPVPTPLMESYQEFTIYEIFKRWYTIIKTG